MDHRDLCFGVGFHRAQIVREGQVYLVAHPDVDADSRPRYLSGLGLKRQRHVTGLSQQCERSSDPPGKPGQIESDGCIQHAGRIGSDDPNSRLSTGPPKLLLQGFTLRSTLPEPDGEHHRGTHSRFPGFPNRPGNRRPGERDKGEIHTVGEIGNPLDDLEPEDLAATRVHRIDPTRVTRSLERSDGLEASLLRIRRSADHGDRARVEHETRPVGRHRPR